ncbi:hypothetical protein FBULB1_8507 [Fusarium bulbicola]|nr:hypothetical protein FBULB1_8507 [Fusarium bulbicola]
MNRHSSLSVKFVEEKPRGVSSRRPDVEADKDFDVLSFIESYSDRHEIGHEVKEAKYRKQEEMLMDSAMDFVRREATDQNGQIAIVNPHPKLSIAHDLVEFVLSRKVATSHLFRRHPIPSNTASQPFPLNMFMGEWTSWAAFTLSRSKEVQPGTRQCCHLMKPGDLEVITVSNDKFVQLMSLLTGDELLMMSVWEMPDASRHHVMRSWLFGVLMINANETLGNSIDLEVHAVATLLHDLGWDTTEESSIISADRRFEVDGAFAARDFIQQHQDGKFWHERSVQLVWDAIALHTERSISYFKELDVQVVSKGIAMDFSGPGYGVSGGDYALIAKAFPKGDLKDSVNDTIIWLCDTKPRMTYDTWMQPFGERYVGKYDPKGKQRIDLIFENLTTG